MRSALLLNRDLKGAFLYWLCTLSSVHVVLSSCRPRRRPSSLRIHGSPVPEACPCPACSGFGCCADPGLRSYSWCPVVKGEGGIFIPALRDIKARSWALEIEDKLWKSYPVSLHAFPELGGCMWVNCAPEYGFWKS